MATTTIEGERQRIHKVIFSTSLAMLFIGIMVTAAGFAIQHEYSLVHWSREWNENYDYDFQCLNRIAIAETYEQ